MATSGETIEYTIIALNDGNVDLVYFSLTDNLFSVIGGKAWSATCSSRLGSRTAGLRDKLNTVDAQQTTFV